MQSPGIKGAGFTAIEVGQMLNRVPCHSQRRTIAHWPAVYRYSVLPVIHSFDIRTRLAALTMPILLINRQDDALSPETNTAWLAPHLPNCAGYHVIPARERFFLYSEAEKINPLIGAFLKKMQRQVEVKRVQE